MRLLELPFGVRDGTTSEGDFSARYQFHQTVHGKRLMGGYLSRVSARRVREVQADCRCCRRSSRSAKAGRSPPPSCERWIVVAPAFVDTARLGWVVIHPSRTPRALHDFAVRALALEVVAVDDDVILYRPGVGALSAGGAAQ